MIPLTEISVGVVFIGAPGGIRTHYPRLRKPILYPNELRARIDCS